MDSQQTDSNSTAHLWHRLTVSIPVAWMPELEAAAKARALPVSGFVRQLIRNMMLARRDADRENGSR